MTDELIEAASELARIIARENEALNALDLAGAARFAETKRQAADDFLAAQSRASAVDPRTLQPARTSAAERIAGELRDVVAENKRLLERAIMVQGRVIATLARTIPTLVPGPRHYRANGAFANAARTVAVALLARA